MQSDREPAPPQLGSSAVVLLILALTALAAPTRAQTPPDPPDPGEGPGPEGAFFLQLPVGATAVGLGRAVTTRPGPESVWWNPAGLGEMDSSSFLLYRGEHPLAGEATAASVVFLNRGVGVVAASYQLMDEGTQNETDIEGNVTGSITVRNHIGVLSIARRFRNRLSVGLNVKLVQHRTSCRGQCIGIGAGVTASTVAVDAGLQTDGLFGLPLRLGAMVANAGSSLKLSEGDPADPLPTRLRVAAGYDVLTHFELPELSLLLTAEVEDRWYDPGSPASYFGAEFAAGAGDVLYVRAGYVFNAEHQHDGAAVGAGLRYERFYLGLAKSLATSIQTGGADPVHISAGVLLR